MVALRQAQGLLAARSQQGPVGQPGERVVVRQQAYLGFGLLVLRDVPGQHHKTRTFARHVGLARYGEFKPVLTTSQRQPELPAGGQAPFIRLLQGGQDRIGRFGWQHLRDGFANDFAHRAVQQLGPHRVGTVVGSMQIQLEQQVGNGAQGGLQLLLRCQDLGGALTHLDLQAVIAQLHFIQQPRQVGHQGAEQQTNEKLERGIL